jgi:segregation and condensation protein A
MSGSTEDDDLVLAAIAEVQSGLADEAPPATEAPTQQTEMPFALVYGQAYTKLPEDLYIPPDALEVFLEAFEGPLDLLLYLIRRQNLDILDIPVAEITHQYMKYVELMRALNFELAAEYLLMAALLGEIKSRMLLPRPKTEDGEEGADPRAELIRRLQEYERFKKAAMDIDAMPLEGRDFFLGKAAAPDYERERPHPHVDLREVLLALQDVLRRADLFESHQVSRETMTLRERMVMVLEALKQRDFVPFVSLFTLEEGRLGVVVTFMSILELVKERLVELVQTESFGPIHLKARVQTSEGEGYDLGMIDDDGNADAFETEPAVLDVAPVEPDLWDDDDNPEADMDAGAEQK